MMQLGQKKKRLLIGVGIGVFLLLVFWLMLRPSPLEVETARAARGPLRVSVDGEGKTRFRDKYTVTAPAAGKMARIRISEGDTIPREYVITQIDPNPPAPRPPSETDELLNPSALKVYAPASGKVLRIFEKSERIVAAGAPLVEIGNPSTVEIVVDVLSTEAAQIRPHAPLLIEREGAADPARARVRTVEPQAFTKVSSLGVEEQRVDVVADFLTREAAAGFGDNFRVDVRIVVWEADDVLKIPSSALFRHGEKWSVFVVEAGRAVRREVAVGHQSRAESEILEGLGEGETVILHPPNQLAEGAAVQQSSH